MKPDFIERIALLNGSYGYWFTILASAFIGAFGGLVIGAITVVVLIVAHGKGQFQSELLYGRLIVVSGLTGFVLCVSWWLKRLGKLKKELQTEPQR
jgi:multisubunit Na+/H+ antiporter MnhB subunit